MACMPCHHLPRFNELSGLDTPLMSGLCAGRTQSTYCTVQRYSLTSLAGGTIPYKTKFQPTVAGLLTEAKSMATYDAGKMILFVRSKLWDLGIRAPQGARAYP